MSVGSDDISQVDCDVLVIGGGTAGPMAAYKAKTKNPQARVACGPSPRSVWQSVAAFTSKPLPQLSLFW